MNRRQLLGRFAAIVAAVAVAPAVKADAAELPAPVFKNCGHTSMMCPCKAPGDVAAITVTNGGSGYLSAPLITFTAQSDLGGMVSHEWKSGTFNITINGETKTVPYWI